MWIARAYRGYQDGKPIVLIEEVEEVKHGERTLYRHPASGRVEPLYDGLGDRIVETREEAVAVVEKMLQSLVAEYAEACRAAVEKLRAQEGSAASL